MSQSTKRLALYGAGGHGKVAAEIAEQIGWDDISFFDNKYDEQTQCGRWPIVGDEHTLFERLNEFDSIFVSIGNNQVRANKQTALINAGASLATLISPRAIISPSVQVGYGSLIVQGAIINIGSQIGSGVIINTGACVDHDCNVEDFAHICPGTMLSGGVQVKKGAWVGIGSSIIQNVVIGQDCIIGAGSVVVSDIADNTKAFGVPAKIKH